MQHKTIIIRWRGPYTLDDVWDEGERFGLYLVTGKMRHQKRPSKVKPSCSTFQGSASP